MLPCYLLNEVCLTNAQALICLIGLTALFMKLCKTFLELVQDYVSD